MQSFYLRVFDFIDNAKPTYLGIYFSLFLHLSILLFAIGLPDFFKPKKIPMPQIVPIEILNTQFNNNFKKLDQIENIKINHPWVKGQNIKVMENLTLKEVLDQILTNFEFETKDMNRFSILMSMIDNYLDPIQETDESDKEFQLKKK